MLLIIHLACRLNGAPTGGVTQEQRILDTATTEFQRRFHISVDDNESRNSHRTSAISQVIIKEYLMKKKML